MKISATDLGRAGEHRVVSELLMRGLRPLLAIVDDGVDIILTNGKTIQVKSTNVKDVQKDTYSYGFGFRTMHVQRGAAARVQKMVADFAICWCAPEDLFYVIPKEAIGNRDRIAITPQTRRGTSIYDKYKEAWGLLK